MRTKKQMGAYEICLTALAVCINMAGGQIALALHLPIYLDSIGTILIASLLGPWFGMLPGLLSGFFMGITVDIYSLYFAPVAMVTGFMAGLVFSRAAFSKRVLPVLAFAVTVPGTLVSSFINAALFGGVTSSGSSLLVQLLKHTPLGLTGSIFTVQLLTDYADRCLSMAVVSLFLYSAWGRAVRQNKGGIGNGTL